MSSDLRRPSDPVAAHVADFAGLVPELDPLVESVVERVDRVAQGLRALLTATAAEHSLTVADWQLLAALTRTGDPFEASPGELARRLRLTAGTVTVRLDRLVDHGLVERRASPTDRRGLVVGLTREGRRTWAQAVAQQAVLERELVSELTVAEQRTLDRLLARLLARLQARTDAARGPAGG